MPQLLRVTPRLPVSDLRRTIRFYTDVLGFAAGESWPDEDVPGFVILCRDGIDLQFYASETGEPPIGPATIYLDTDDASGFHEAIRDRVDVEWGPEVYEYGRREFAFRDPDGYAVIVSEATDDPVTDSD